MSDLWGRGSESDEEKDSDSAVPPEMDKLWRDLNGRVNNVLKFKRKGGGGNPEKPKNKNTGSGGKKGPMGASFVFIAVVLVAIGAWLLTGTFTVQEGQVAVVMTFGKHSETKLPGISWRWPSPIQTHQLVNVSQVRTVEVGYRSTVADKRLNEALMLTNDENIIDIQFAVQYRLKNATDWLFNNRDQEIMVRQVAETAIREVVGKSKMDFVLYEGRDVIALDANKLMQSIFDQYGSGVQITNVTMQGVQPPEEVQEAFDDAVKAGQDLERQKNEGQAYANDVIPRARGAASRLNQEAEGYHASVIANAEGEASRFKQVLREYSKAPRVTRDRMYLATMQGVFENTTKMMVDTKKGSSLLYLPLDKLIQQTGRTAESAPVNENIVTTAPVENPIKSSVTNDSRDSRSRGGR